MEKSEMMDAALDKILSELDDVEGNAAMSHSQDECPDPLNCKMHEAEASEPLEKLGPNDAPGITLEIKKEGMPSLGGEDESGSDSLSPEESEMLKKLLK